MVRGDSLEREATRLEELVAARRKALTDEAKDVARLERLSLSSIVSTLQNSRATDLEREASLRAHQAAVEADLTRLTAERDGLLRQRA